ncbi:hypothetical protein SLS57_005285 [Botryosphaeria dothidea]
MAQQTPSPHAPSPKSNCPDLPIELWMHILASITTTEDLPHLWFAARATSRTLRAAMERVVPTAHLRDWLHVCTFRVPRSRLAFERLSPTDRNKAVLRARPWRGFEESPVDVRRRGSVLALADDGAEAWGEYLRGRGERGFGDHMVCLRGVVQDTEVCGWEVVREGEGVFEVEVEWRGLVDGVFGEELRARRRGEALAKRFKKDRDAKWAYFGPEVLSGKLDFKTFEAVLLGNENHRAYQNGYRDARRLRVEKWIKSIESDPQRARVLRKKEIDAEWVPNFRMNAVRERMEKKMVEWGEETKPMPSYIRRRLLESDIPMNRELGTMNKELKKVEDHYDDEDEVEAPGWTEVGLLWKGKSVEEVEHIMKMPRAWE